MKIEAMEVETLDLSAFAAMTNVIIIHKLHMLLMLFQGENNMMEKSFEENFEGGIGIFWKLRLWYEIGRNFISKLFLIMLLSPCATHCFQASV